MKVVFLFVLRSLILLLTGRKMRPKLFLMFVMKPSTQQSTVREVVRERMGST